jgi:hypothetical protein
VLEETTDEFLGTDDAVPDFSSIRVLVAKGDVIVFYFQDAIVTASATVAHGHAKDIGSQILQCSYPTADGLKVNHPIFLPRLSGDALQQGRFLQFIAELGPKQDGEGLDDPGR